MDRGSATQQVVHRLIDAGVGFDATDDGLTAAERDEVLGQARCAQRRERSLLEARRVSERFPYLRCGMPEAFRVLLREEDGKLQAVGGADHHTRALDRALPLEELAAIGLLKIDDEEVGLLRIYHVCVHFTGTLRADRTRLKVEGCGADDNQTEEFVMRMLGYALIAASVLFGAGGVTVRAADPSPAQSSADAEAIASQSEASSCLLPKTPSTRTLRINPLASATKGAKSVFVLNTRGFNYARPGSLPVLPPGDPVVVSSEDQSAN